MVLAVPTQCSSALYIDKTIALDDKIEMESRCLSDVSVASGQCSVEDVIGRGSVWRALQGSREEINHKNLASLTSLPKYHNIAALFILSVCVCTQVKEERAYYLLSLT